MIFNLTQITSVSAQTVHTGGELQILATGTFDGATLSLFVMQEGLTATALTEYELMAPTVRSMSFKQNTTYYFQVANATGSTDIQISII